MHVAMGRVQQQVAVWNAVQDGKHLCVALCMEHVAGCNRHCSLLIHMPTNTQQGVPMHNPLHAPLHHLWTTPLQVRQGILMTGSLGKSGTPHGTPKAYGKSPLESPLISDPTAVQALNLEPGKTKVCRRTRMCCAWRG